MAIKILSTAPHQVHPWAKREGGEAAANPAMLAMPERLVPALDAP